MEVFVRRLTLAVATIAVVASAVVGPGTAVRAAAPDAPAVATVAPGLEEKAADGEVPVIAVTRVPGEQVLDEVVADLPDEAAAEASAGSARQVVVTVDAEGLEALAANPEVVEVVENKVNRIAADPWAEDIGLPAAQSAGWDGTGRTVAVLDTGVQANHPYLAGRVIGEACFSQPTTSQYQSLCPGEDTEVVAPGAAAPCASTIPGCDHGTHVAGIAAGGPVTSPSALTGVAHDASVIAVKVFSKGLTPVACGGGSPPCLVAFDSEIVAALSWLKDRRLAADPMVASLDAVNLSLGGQLYTGSCDSTNGPILDEVDALRALGIATVVASGNNGYNGSGLPARMASPACISTVVSVGATNGSGGVAGYSNLTSGTTLVAPGSSIVSSLAGSSYGTKSGTSMATPVVAGALAALRERSPAIDVTAAVALLRSTGDRVTTGVGVMPELQLDQVVADVPGRPTRAPGAPFGTLDSVTAGQGTVSLAGWAIDPETASSIAVHVYIDGAGHALTANGPRPDVHAAFGYGPNHGYSLVTAVAPGSHQVCAYGINVGSGANALLGCRTLLVSAGPPIGSLDSVTTAPGSVTLTGWAIDPDSPSPITVHLYVDGAAAAVVAGTARPDVDAAFPGYGPNHGFVATLGASGGRHTVCAYGINVGIGANSLLGCRSVVVPSGSPIGSLDSVVRDPGGTVTVSGWAIDPDVVGPVQVHLYLDGAVMAVTANGVRPDVDAAFPAYASNHGYRAVLGAAPGSHTVCAYAINVGLGSNRALGCRTVL